MATFLSVDDAAFVRSRLAKLLESMGHTVLQAENGEQGVSLYKQTHPDLVLMDISMPVMDGIAAVKEIKAYDPKARIIMISALGQQRYVIASIRAGAMDFVVKPFSAPKLMEAIRRALPESGDPAAGSGLRS